MAPGWHLANMELTAMKDKNVGHRAQSGAKIPAPAHPQHRRTPLPGHQPKPVHEDADAPARVQAILESPSYREADQDVAFLNRDDTRGVRLQIDYWKPELLLEQHHIRHTIVVFGSTRIPEPASAERQLQLLRERLATQPDNPELGRAVKIAERLRAMSKYYDVARQFGRLVGEAGKNSVDGNLVVMTGGGPGMMEAANRGSYDVHAENVGLNITLPQEQYPNPYISPELCFSFHYFALRKLHFLLRAKALVAFPGGYGTFDELFETLALIQTRKIPPLPVVLVGEEFWRRAVNFDFLVEEGVIDIEDRELFWFAETAEDAWEGILQWYRLSGKPLLPLA
jgi:uncharacterized protein (TIGR00730 family)